jgi:hypothetical protein
VQSDGESAGVAPEGPSTSQRAGVKGFHSDLSSRGWGLWMVSMNTNYPSEKDGKSGLFSA